MTIEEEKTTLPDMKRKHTAWDPSVFPSVVATPKQPLTIYPIMAIGAHHLWSLSNLSNRAKRKMAS